MFFLQSMCASVSKDLSLEYEARTKQERRRASAVMESSFFQYGDVEINGLIQADAVLGEAIGHIGKIERAVMPDLFEAFIYAVIGQVISVKAARSAWIRLQNLLDVITPAAVAASTPEMIQTCGITMKKAQCIHRIAQRITNHEIELDDLRLLPDEIVIEQLTSFEGIGRWTAEMLLLHSLQRPDIVSWGDIAIRRGMMKLYGMDSLSKKQFDYYKQRYSPFGSVASIYLWKISNG